jgi:hypothetical protein
MKVVLLGVVSRCKLLEVYSNVKFGDPVLIYKGMVLLTVPSSLRRWSVTVKSNLHERKHQKSLQMVFKKYNTLSALMIHP